jgi:signal transduction histidine kinase
MQNFLEYYKPSSHKVEFDIKESIKASMSIINTKIKNHDVIIRILGQSFTTVGIKNQWMQIWLNLLNNSINQAVKKSIKIPKIEIVIHKNIISFEDNCEGFDEEILKNFQSEKFNGLGLKMSKDIANQYDWDIEILNKRDGAVIKIFKKISTK